MTLSDSPMGRGTMAMHKKIHEIKDDKEELSMDDIDRLVDELDGTLTGMGLGYEMRKRIIANFRSKAIAILHPHIS